MSKRSGIMLAYPFEEKRLAKWKPPYIVQPKLDGERCRAMPRSGGGYDLLSSEGNVFISVPHINEALSKSGLWPHKLDGELYRHGMAFEDIHSIVSRTVNLHPDYKEMEYHIFDIVNDHPQIERLSILSEHITVSNPIIKRVTESVPDNFTKLMKRYDDLINEGYEGMVVRHWLAPYVPRRSTFMMKFKPKKDDYYKITGFKEEVSIHGEPKGRLGAVECESDGQVFSVGSGLTDELRETLWNCRDTLPGKLLHVAYQHITSGKGVPRFPVFLEVVEDEPKEVGLKV